MTRSRFFGALLVVLATTLVACDPCRGLDAAFTPPAVAPIVTDSQGAQIEVQASIPALSTRLGAAFAGERVPVPGGELVPQTLSLERRNGVLTAVVGVRLLGVTHGTGVVDAPVSVVTRVHGAGLRVLLDPGIVTLRLPELAPDGALTAAAARGLRIWLDASPILAVPGWFRAEGVLPLRAVDARIDGAVLIVQIATGLAGPALTEAGRARRPGLADDATIAISWDLLSAMASAGFVPFPVAPELGRAGTVETTPVPPAMPPGWRVRPGVPRPSERALHIPFAAHRTDRCGVYEAAVESRPGTALGAPGWRAPQPKELRVTAGETPSPGEEAVVSRYALAALLAPVVPLPVLGPGVVLADRGPARLVRIESDALLIDAVLTNVKAPPRPRPPGGLPPPHVPRASP